MGKAARPDADSQSPSILSLIKQVQYKAYVRLESVFQPLGVTAVQFRVLTTLGARPGLSSADLARLYGVKPQTMVKQVALLEGKGLIGRQASPAHGRLLLLSLTAEGEAILAQCQAGAQAMERTLLDPLDAADQARLRAMLVTLNATIGGPALPDADDPDIEEFSRAGVQRA